MKIISTKEAAYLINSGDKVGTVGFMVTGAPEEIFIEIEKRFLETNTPRDLTLMWASGIGDGTDQRGINHLAHENLLKRVIAGHYGLIPRLGPLINENKVEAYNFPQGVLTGLFREMGAKRPGILTHVGLGTFVDPDLDGGKLNSITTEDIVKKVNIEGKDFLLYKSQEIDVAIVRGTEADEFGNIGYSEEALKLENMSVAMAAKNNGGIVIAQVKKLVKNGEIDPRCLSVPASMVDYVAVVEDEKNHMQTTGTQFNEKFITISNETIENENVELPLDIRTLIAKRCEQFIDDESKILNYGIGLPESVALVVKAKGNTSNYTATIEPGVIGGFAQAKFDFGSSIYPESIIEHQHQFDNYSGGGIDITFLGMAQCNAQGSINVSKFGVKIPGCGGFIDISQNAKKIVFCGTFTAGGLEVDIADNKLVIVNEGKGKKFVNNLDQITFNGLFEGKKQKEIYVVTERAVFSITEQGLTLIEIAPGIDLEKDILANMEYQPIISSELKTMDEKLFTKGENV